VDESFDEGLLRVTSFARPGKLFTANQELMIAKAGTLKIGPLEQIVEAIMSIPRNSLRQ
jgi:hypothetical protein